MQKADPRKFHYIYKTICKTTGRFYVGMHSTDELDDGYLGSGVFLWKSIKKYGKDDHVKEIVELSPDRKSLRIREEKIIDEQFLKDPLCMNLKNGGGHGPWLDPATRNARISVALKGKKQSIEAVLARSTALKGHSVSVATRNKISLARTGMKFSKETRSKLSLSHLAFKQTEEHIEKRRLANRISQNRPDVKERKRMAMIEYYARKRAEKSR